MSVEQRFGPNTPAIERVLAQIARQYSSVFTDPREVVAA